MSNLKIFLHENLRLHVTQTHFYIESLDPNDKEILIIDRVTQELTLSKNLQDLPLIASEIKHIHGIFGITRLLAGPYLIIITKKVKVGEINNKPIWKVVATETLPYQRNIMHLNEQQQQDNTRYLAMVENVLLMENFYFSTSYDVTHTVQRLFNTSPDFKTIPFNIRADDRFLWNSFVLRDLSQQSELSSFTLPIMLGFISINTCIIKGQLFKYILISRRSRYRAGTRYNIRGIDGEGNVANFVETEQIIEFQNTTCSFIQTRGSVPLFWLQDPNLKYKPLPKIANEDHLSAFARHFSTQIYNYGKQVIINLLDQKKPELGLVDSYEFFVKKFNNEDVTYIAFDFHKECKKMQWHKLEILLSTIRKFQKQFDYFRLTNESETSQQSGVFRTNCIDCLDRTNVVQSMIARVNLNHQLIALGLLNEGERFETFREVESVFRNTWADNADACAKQYAGTGALKTDFTRTGKRTIMGAILDGWNSLKRYFINNFYDGFNQDSQDLFLGNYEIDSSPSSISPFKSEKDWKIYALPCIFAVAFSMCLISILLPDEHRREQIMYVLFWGGASFVTMATIMFYGREFVDKPKLVIRKLKVE